MNLDRFPPDAPLCASGKRPFRTEAQAAHHLAEARARVGIREGRRPGVTEAGYYQCPACRWWHLRSSTRPQRRGELSDAKSNKRRRS